MRFEITNSSELRDFPGEQLTKFPHPSTPPLQIYKRLGEPRGVYPALGFNPDIIFRVVGCLCPELAGPTESKRSCRTGVDYDSLPAFHPFHIQSVYPVVSGSRGRPGSQSDSAGHRIGHSSAIVIRGLCRFLAHVFLCSSCDDQREN